MPAAQKEIGERARHEEDRHARERDQHQRREHARDVQTVAGFNNTKRQPRPLPGRAGGDLGDDGADQRQSAADPQAGKEIGQRGGNGNMASPHALTATASRPVATRIFCRMRLVAARSPDGAWPSGSMAGVQATCA